MIVTAGCERQQRIHHHHGDVLPSNEQRPWQVGFCKLPLAGEDCDEQTKDLHRLRTGRWLNST